MKCTKHVLVGTAAVVAAAGVGFAVLPAFAPGGGQPTNAADATGHPGHGDGDALATRGERAAAAQPKGALLFAASLNGANEVPVQGGPAVGDRDGVALQFVKVQGDQVSVAVKFRGTDKPTALHIHQGGRGANGGVKVDFTSLLARGAEPLKGWAGAVSGTVRVTDRAVLDAFTGNPRGFYANLHTARFPGGAVRGQFHRVTTAFPFPKALDNFQASVVKGQQIYRCEKGAGGRYAFQQHDVRAVLGGPIAHSFVAPGSGKPQWIAADRSAVTGTLINKFPQGAGNIPELDLRAEQSGRKKGLLAKSQEILRLNTVGGVAPAGTCVKGKIIGVPYGADYVFIQK